MIDWDRPDWGNHISYASNGSDLDAERAEEQ